VTITKQMRVGLRGIRTDADTWEKMTPKTRKAYYDLQGLTLGGHELSWAAVDVGLVDTYAALHHRILSLLTGAGSYFSEIGHELRTAADGYESADLRGAADISRPAD
jgi:hypothetical protein